MTHNNQHLSFRVMRGIAAQIKKEILHFVQNDKVQGFTLVELAIALMVIGLLIGGVLKGQELIENARIIRVVKDVNDYDTAIMIFRSTYNALPGDMKRPTRLPNCDTAPCHNAGNGNRKINGNQERYNFWIHLSRAGLIGPININEEPSFMSISPQNSLGGHYVVDRRTFLYPSSPTSEHPDTNVFFIGDDAASGYHMENCMRMAQIDQKMDDGLPFTGKVKLPINQEHAQTCFHTDTNTYTQDKTGDTYIMVTMPSMN